MILFHNDYSEGCHEKIMEALIATNMEQTPGYSEDKYCDEARALIRKVDRDELMRALVSSYLNS